MRPAAFARSTARSRRFRGGGGGRFGRSEVWFREFLGMTTSRDHCACVGFSSMNATNENECEREESSWPAAVFETHINTGLPPRLNIFHWSAGTARSERLVKRHRMAQRQIPCLMTCLPKQQSGITSLPAQSQNLREDLTLFHPML